MNIPRSPEFCSLTIAFAGLALLLAATSASAQPAAGERKSHLLYLGTDLEVQQGSEMSPVAGVDRRSFVVKTKGGAARIPMKGSAGSLRVLRRLKLTDLSVEVSGLSFERSYSAGNTPAQRMAQASSQFAVQSLMQESTDAALRAEAVSYSTVGPNNVALVNAPPGGTPADPRSPTELAANRAAAISAMPLLPGGNVNTPFESSDLLDRTKSGNYDAIEVEFNVTSPRPLAAPYVILTADIIAPGDKPGEVRNWIYATEVKPISNDLLHVSIKEVGLPPGYELRNPRLHLYDGGQEIGTSVAQKRVELTLDEAFDYLMIDYLGENKDQTVAATPALGRIPAATRQALAGTEFYVRVSKDGIATGTFSDARAKQPLDNAALEAALRTMRFKPALKSGQPVEGMVRMKL